MDPAEPLDRLLFRRQFVLGPRPFAPFRGWSSSELTNGLVLSVHPDLGVVSHTSSRQLLVVIGEILDPYHPESDSSEIVRRIGETGEGIEHVLRATEPLAGRWVVIYKNVDKFVLFNDPCGLRRVFFHASANGIWCGSDPAIIKANTALRPDERQCLREFLGICNSPHREGAWVGDGTLYSDCLHLMPNHYLDLRSATAVRFFPWGTLDPSDVDAAAREAAKILQGTIAALHRRKPVMLGVTAGWDSRVLLSASRQLLPSIYCYVERLGILPTEHHDIQIPLRLSQNLGFRFTVEDSWREPPPWFHNTLQRNVTMARKLPKTRSIYTKLHRGEHRVSLNGNGSEICRRYFDKFSPNEVRDVTLSTMAAMLGYPGNRFVEKQLLQWQSSLSGMQHGFEQLDLLYWEQRMGNWGGHYPAEQDIAVEEISPFNNRRLLTTLLSVAPEHRLAPDYVLYTSLMAHLWPAVLSEPFNRL